MNAQTNLLNDSDLIKLRNLRHYLHRNPELSGKEKHTAEFISDFLKELNPDELHAKIGGFGVAAVFNGKEDGAHFLFRCELDALPIDEQTEIDYRSQQKGVSHKCGHDGHMAILSGLALVLSKERPSCGKVTLLFQPAEEIGKGAALVLEDELLKAAAPDFVYALHNLPGYPMHQVIVKEGAFNPAVHSLIVRFKGATSHAAEPEKGRNPALAMAELLTRMMSMNEGEPGDARFATIVPVYQKMGEKAYGVSAGKGEVHFTMRCDTELRMRKLEENAEQTVREIAAEYELEFSTEWIEPFSASYNHIDAVGLIKSAASDLGFDLHTPEVPFRWGEDFGLFTQKYKGALFCIGAGENSPALHSPDYDFPDEIIESGVRIFYQISQKIARV